MTNLNLNHLTLTSTLAELPNFTYHIEENVSSAVLAEILEKNPEMPGGIITHNSQVIGMFSRQKIEQIKNLSSWRQSYKDYPIKKLLQATQHPPLILADNFLINSAIKVALDRPSEQVFEPIVVLFATGDSRLIRMTDLILAQTYLLQSAITEITEWKNSRSIINQNTGKTGEVGSNLPPTSKYLIHKIKSKLHDHQSPPTLEVSNTASSNISPSNTP